MTSRSVVGLLLSTLALACAARVPLPPPQASGSCVQSCQQNHALCLQGAGMAPSGGYGDASAALVGGLLQLAVARSGQSQCAETLGACYSGCGQRITEQQASLADYCSSLRCDDGSPGLWVGYAKALGLKVGVGMYMCAASPGKVEGQWSCSQIQAGVGCATSGGIFDGTNEGNRVKLRSEKLPGGVFSDCGFDGHYESSAVIVGDYQCSGPRGLQKGRFEIQRCP